MKTLRTDIATGRPRIVALALPLAALLAAAAPLAQVGATRELDELRARHREADQRAARHLQAVLEEDPRRPLTEYVQLAELYPKIGRLDEGRAFFEQLGIGRPDLWPPLVGRALLARSAGEAARGWELLAQAREKAPQSVELLPILLEFADTDERRDEVEALLRAWQAEPAAPWQVTLYLGELALTRGRLVEAEAVLGRALAASRGDPIVVRALGILYGRSDPLRAITTLQDLARRHPEDGETWFHLGRIEQQIGLLPAARDHLERALERGQDGPPVLNRLARLVEREGDRRRAVDLLRRSLVADPDQPDVQRYLERMLSKDPRER